MRYALPPLGIAVTTLLLCSCVGPTGTPPDTRKVYTAADARPDFSDRRTALVPDAIPPGVHVRYAKTDQVIRCARRLAESLVDDELDIYADTVLVQPGAWRVVQGLRPIGDAESRELKLLTPGVSLEEMTESALIGRVLRSEADKTALAQSIESLLREAGPYQVRTLTAAEMTKWWQYTGAEIAEPVFVVASHSGTYAFVFAFDADDRIHVVDELRALPDLD
ncbi:hypothetical protein [Opitutus sp. ER46]|uniref:hypothetical protein n=1 Tax=Opitutus sp. ER46 TaxID=2161864 RepID=UPI000D30A90D|nr:hypothetical protein [Opitutus sp. ER46]PTY01083.1 hypothetical protein DB354_00680 [Opitutus sp. ER46]